MLILSLLPGSKYQVQNEALPGDNVADQKERLDFYSSNLKSFLNQMKLEIFLLFWSEGYSKSLGSSKLEFPLTFETELICYVFFGIVSHVPIGRNIK